MSVLLLILMFPLVAACSTMGRPASPSAVSAAISEPSGLDIEGRWRGNWTGTGFFQSRREDAITLDLVQRGDTGYGRLVLEGTNAAESVPEQIRRAGLWGTRVFAEISRDRVTLRHQVDGRLFTADLKLAGDQMYGFVRGGRGRRSGAHARAVAQDWTRDARGTATGGGGRPDLGPRGGKG